MSSNVPELEPVDTKRRQAEQRHYNPFRLGGPCHTTTRCANKPTLVVGENEADENGQAGAMSLCDKCVVPFRQQFPESAGTHWSKPIGEWT